ncbi:MAG: glycosyltransferase family 39 protein [Anaerolineae bacterium]|nr:glycosyltransferase family 39 protein [Anaerolineae bacterium]
MQYPTGPQTSRRERCARAAILTAFTILAALYSAVTPIFEASDELWHYPMVQYIAAHHGALPVQDPANLGPWKQEGGQPPLYYYIGAAATFWIDTSDMPDVRRENPHVDNGIVTPDGNTNLVVHNAEAEAFPWTGTALAVHIIRLLSILMGAGTVYCTYALARELFPERVEVRLGAAALLAFTPMFLFISGSVNNDNLSNLLSGLLLLMLVRMVKYPEHATLQSFAAIGVVGGLGLLAKYSVGFLLILAGAAFFYVWYRRRDWRLFALGTLLAAFLTILIAGWWYERNIELYGDPTGLNVFVEILGARQVPADAAQLWRERDSFLHGYWGLFGGLNVPMADWTYPIFNAIGLAGLAGLVIHALASARQRGKSHRRDIEDTEQKGKREIDNRAVAGLLALAWPVIVFVSWAKWASTTWSSQGRLVYSAITAITVWLAFGLVAWAPARYARWRAGLMGGVVAFFALCAVAAPFAWIAPAYAPPPELAGEPPAGFAPIDFYEPGSDAPAMQLLGCDVSAGALHPGDQVEITLYWKTLSDMSRNWSVFVHLTDSNGVPVAQRDAYPGVGLLATRDLLPGRTFADRYVVQVPGSAYTPDTLTLNVGLYDYTTCPVCERMHIGSARDFASLHEITLEPAAESDFPNPASINFGGKAELAGYALDARRAAPGDTLTLTLYWRALSTMDANYTVFAHVVGADTHIWANGDAWPTGPGGDVIATAAWQPGDIIEDVHTLALDPNTPPGVYPIEIGFFVQNDAGGFERLVIITGSHEQEQDFVYLSKIRVTGAGE